MDLINTGTVLDKQHRGMIDRISQHLPAIDKATAQHNKARTQFQLHSIDMAGPVAGPTKLRNARRLLAEIEQTRAALEESHYKIQKLEIRAKMFRNKAEVEYSGAKCDLFLVSAEELESQVQRGQRAMQGAVRKLAAFVEQYKHIEQLILQELGKDEITEEDFEADEERFHIMKAFEQALCASRSMGQPQIDHGNYIYLHDIGINGLLARQDLAIYWEDEVAAYKHRNLSPRQMHKMEMDWLEAMATKYKGCATDYAERKGLKTIIPYALLS